jgi:lauroyl/myristoyl acyltransferase
MTYWLYRAAASLLPRMHESIGYPLFDLLGALAYLLSGSARSLVSRNMRHILGPAARQADVQRYTREAFRNLARNYYDLFHMRGFTKENLRARMDIAGLENLDRALERGKGVLLTSPHFGNTEYLMQVPTLYPYMRFMLLVEQMDDLRLFELLRALRAGLGMDLATVAQPLKVIRRLRQNGVVGIAFDRDVTHNGIDTEFFGQPAVFAPGAVRLAMTTGAAIVPAYGWRAAQRGRFQVHVCPALELVNTADAEADVQTNLRRLLAIFEPLIRERPGHWMAFHEVWKSAPATVLTVSANRPEAAEVP